jgi:hypothetical protein
MHNYQYNIGYESQYLFRAPPRAMEGAHASEGFSFNNFMVNLPLSDDFQYFVFIPIYELLLLSGYRNSTFTSRA